MSSVRPAPTRPANPRISPWCAWKLIPLSRSSTTSRTSSATSLGSPRKSWARVSFTSRPTIRVARSCGVTSATFLVATRYPSRSTVTLWQTSPISLRRWEM